MFTGAHCKRQRYCALQMVCHPINIFKSNLIYSEIWVLHLLIRVEGNFELIVKGRCVEGWPEMPFQNGKNDLFCVIQT